MITRRGLLLAPLAAGARATRPTERGFLPLFNGRDLTGWEGDRKLWRVERGALLGSTEGQPIGANSFLITTRRFADFVLRLQARLRNHNSGVQFRSERLAGFAVRGYQADIGDGYWGNLYEEAGTRGTLREGGATARQAVKPQGWNDLEIACSGRSIRLSLNGTVTAALEDDRWREGVIALQLHAGPAMQVWFRRIRVKAGR